MAVRNKLYYPQSQIVTNLYTSGKEWMTEKGQEYIGYYHKYIDGKIASGAVYVKDQSVTLIKYIDHVVQPDNALYNSLIKTVGLPDEQHQLHNYFKLGLCYGFSHATPNSTLPIFWYETDNWIPLLNR